MPPVESEALAEPRPRLLTPTFVLLLASNLAFSFALSSFFILPKFMAQELSARASEIGAVATTFGIIMVATTPLVGRLLERCGERGVLWRAGLLLALSALGFTAVDEMGVLIVALRCLQALALSMFANASSLLVAELVPAQRLAQGLGIFAGVGTFMTAFGPAAVEWIAERKGYAPAFVLAGAASALSTLVALRLPGLTPPHPISSSFGDVLKRESSLRMIAVLASAGLGFGVMFTFSQPFALELSLPNVRDFFIAFAVCSALVRIALGSVVDRVGPRRAATLSLLGYGAAVMSMAALSPVNFVILGGLFGLSHGVFVPAFTAFVLVDGAPEERGKLMTLFHGAFNGGHCLVVLLGLLADRHGYAPVFALTGTLLLTGPLLLAGWPARATNAHATEPQ